MTDYLCEPLSKRHDRKGFDCGVAQLNDWFQQRARQDQDRHVAAVFVMSPVGDPTRVAGFYSLSATSIHIEELPGNVVRKLPRYPVVPAILIGRLARDLAFPGAGSNLLIDAIERAVRHINEIAAAVIVVDAMDERAAKFYARFGFAPLTKPRLRLYLRIESAHELAGRPRT